MKTTLKLTLVLSALVLCLFANAQVKGEYAPGASYEGTNAIHKDSSIIKSWAIGIELYRGYTDISDGTTLADYGVNSDGLGLNAGLVSLGDGGVATLTFDRPIINGDGPDFAVFENAFEVGGTPGIYFLELAFVEVSSDGVNFVRFPAISATDPTTQVGGFGGIDPTDIYNLAGKYETNYGTPFNLDDVAGEDNLDVNNIRFVRIIDVVGSIDPAYASYDSEGNIINDPYPTAFGSSGFDLDGVALINGGAEYQLADMNDLTLASESYWNGSDETGFFESGLAHFINEYNSTYSSWTGFSYSNMTDNTTAGSGNQYSSITAGGMNATASEGTNFALAYIMLDWMGGTYDPIPVEMNFTDNAAHEVNGFYVTNSTYTALSMENGDAFAKQFGGVSGDDPDWLKLNIWGTAADNSLTDTIEFYLADYRFADNTEDYIVENWRWVDLSSLGAVKDLHFSMLSTDVGDYGMNTPAYFCMDNLIVGEYAPVENPIENIIAYENDENMTMDLDVNFGAGDNSLTYQILVNTNQESVEASLSESNLIIDFVSEGQSKIIISAEYDGNTVYDTIIVGVLPVLNEEFEIANFEDLSLEENSFWNGDDQTGDYTTGLSVFNNIYNSEYMYWNGFSYSNVDDTETSGMMNQYAAYTGAGVDPVVSEGSNYGVCSAFGSPIMSFANSGYHAIEGVHITNSTYAALSMLHGDAYAKKFGGATGNDEDWFKLTITGKLNGAEVGTVDFYLADYRFADNDEDFIIETWQWVDLSTFGQVDTLTFALSSSDVGDYGMNTPAYFCIDNVVFTDDAPVLESDIEDILAYDNDEDMIITLSDVFSDNDDVDENIFYSVSSNSNDATATAIISGNELTIDFLAEGTTEVTVEANSNGHIISDTFTVTVDEFVSVEDVVVDNVSVYPNPAIDYINIRGVENATISIFDMSGRLVQSQTANSNVQFVDMSKYKAGMYSVRIETRENTVIRKFIKE